MAILANLLSYDPADVDPALREQMAGVLKTRSEILSASAEVFGLRARVWMGDSSPNDFIDLRGATLERLRVDYRKQMIELLKAGVDVDGLLETLPIVALVLMRHLKVPLVPLLETLGVDFDVLKSTVAELKDMFEDD